MVIFNRLKDNHGFNGSYSSVRRFILHLEATNPKAFIRIEVEPGAQAQVDFGYGGEIYDPEEKRMRRAWIFVMVLSHSRHQFAQFVFDQSIETWIDLHRRAFNWFGGIPREIVIDNLKAGIARVCFYDPAIQRTYLEFAEHYGFMISPCKIKKPEHKGKVEAGGVKYIKNNFLPGRELRDIIRANVQLLTWCVETAGNRIHGTTKQKPIKVFEEFEKQALLALPSEPYEIVTWKECKLHPDCHIVFEGGYYSVPYRFIGQYLWVCGTDKTVSIFMNHEQVAMHSRATRKGQWQTNNEHLPPEKVAYLMHTPTWCCEKAKEIGECTGEFIERLLGDRPLNRLRAAQGVLGLANKYGKDRLEAACKRALAYDELYYSAISRILEKGLDKESVQLQMSLPYSKQTPKYARSWEEFFSSDKEEIANAEPAGRNT
jgi:transposase